MAPIKNYKVYVSGMEKSMEDKLFWLDRIPKEEYSVVVDYGCADGTFLKKVRDFNPDCSICGIDIDDWMLNEAKKKFGSSATFINEAFLNKPSHLQGDVLNLSSVIHEVYSYKKPAEIRQFWEYVNGYKYVCIRDMCVESYSLNNFVVPELEEISIEEKERRKEFEEIWGTIKNPKNFVHYMLKYRYDKNWDREVRENYLPLEYQDLQRCANLIGYDVVYSEHYVLPFLKEKIKEDWGINLTVPTHVKMIWKLKE